MLIIYLKHAILKELASPKRVNESRFSNHFIEKRDLSYPESLVIRGFPLFYIKMPSFQNSLTAKLIFLHVASI